MTSSVSFTWSTRREANDGYVLETGPEGHAMEFGPMPCWIVLAFVESRRRLVGMMAEKYGATYSEEETDYSFLLDNTDGVQQ